MRFLKTVAFTCAGISSFQFSGMSLADTKVTIQPGTTVIVDAGDTAEVTCSGSPAGSQTILICSCIVNPNPGTKYILAVQALVGLNKTVLSVLWNHTDHDACLRDRAKLCPKDTKIL